MNDERAQPNTPSADHDLLIKIDTKFDILSDKFDALSSNIVARVDTLEKDSVAMKQQVRDIADDGKETKMDVKFLNRYAWMAIGVVGALELYLLYRQAFPR